jgi:flavin-dependent dehydrogenase
MSEAFGETASRTYAALVVGGGLAGSALSISLAQSGRDVLLVEKSAAAHAKICGEFLSHEALHYLAALGIDLEALGAVSIDGVRLAGQEIVAATRLPFRSLSLSRERLDEALLKRAAHAGVSVLRQRRVMSLANEGGRWSAQTDAGETLAGEEAFLAIGKHDLYGWNRPAGRQNDLMAFKMYWRLAPSEQAALERHVELILFTGGYAGLQPVEEGMANLCLLVRKQVFRAMGGNWPALLAYMRSHAAHLDKRLAGATALWERPLSLSSIPYGLVRRDAQVDLWRLGDQSVVIPSFAGEGMSIALHSARLAAAMYTRGDNAEQYQRRLAHDVARQVSLATLLSKSLVNRHAAPALSALARLWPGILAHVARSTRIRMEDLLC